MDKFLFNPINPFKKHQVVVLAYHNVNVFGEKLFEEQMIFLKDNYDVIPLNKLVEYLKNGAITKAKYAAITFDDGYRDNYEIAYPILERQNIPATLYLTSGYLDSNCEKYLTWDMARKMINSGLISIGNHTYSHKILSILSREEQEREIKLGRERIEDMLAVKPASFAYPFGQLIHYTHDTIDILKKDGYDFAVSAFPMVIKSPFNDLYEIPRISFYNVKSLREFKIRMFIFWCWLKKLKTVYLKRESLNSHENIENAISPFIKEMLSGKVTGGDEVNVRLKKWRTYNWSHILFLNVNFAEPQQKIVIKIPKLLEVNHFTLHSSLNKKLVKRGESEYYTIRKLYNFFSKSEFSSKLEIVRPLGYIKSLNGIVMEDIHGEKLFRMIKTNQLSKDKVCGILRLIGQAISYYHKNLAGVKNQPIVIDEIFSPYRGLHSFFDSEIDLIIHDVGEEIQTFFSRCLLGLEVRNIFYSARDDKIILYDILKLPERPIFDDIAEFLVSIDLITYKNLRVQKIPKKDYYISFLEGYFGEEGYSPQLLKVFLLKEYMRFYSAQMNIISRKKYGHILQKININSFILKKVKRKIQNNFLMIH